MKMIILLASATMLAAAPAAANPGNGHDNGNGHGNSAMTHGNSGHATMAHGNSGHVATTRLHSNEGVIHTSHGRLYAMDARGSCPPGLAKKNNGCLPPGQAKKYYNVGQRYNRNFGNTWTYNQIPSYLRNQYLLDQSDQYYYRNGYLYQVDPKTMMVQQAISALLR